MGYSLGKREQPTFSARVCRYYKVRMRIKVCMFVCVHSVHEIEIEKDCLLVFVVSVNARVLSEMDTLSQ
jgi:intracellular sulfur oxidation DsrE/DsrF family protein